MLPRPRGESSLDSRSLAGSMTPLWNRFAPLRSRGIPASSSSAGIPLVFLAVGVVAVVVLAVLDFIDNDAAFQAGVASTSSAATALDNPAQRLFDGATDDLDAELLVLVAHYI